MKPLKNFCWLITFLFFFSASTYAQVFNIGEYFQFLETHQNMNTEALLQLHSAGYFNDQINTNYEEALYFDSLNGHFNFTNYEKSLIGENGFMISERLKRTSFGQALLEIFNQDLPVFVSTDAILHAFHISYDRILQEIEIVLLEPKLIAMLNSMRSSMPQLHNKYSAFPEMMTMLKDVDVYLTVPLILLNQATAPYYPENSGLVNNILNWIATEQPATNILFSST